MFTCQVPVSKNRKLLEMEVEHKRRELMKYKEYINPKDNECVRVLEAEKTKKEEDLKNCYWIQYWAKSNLINDILKLRRRIDGLKLIEKLERELEILTQELHDIPGEGWGGYPGSLDAKIVVEYRNKFKTLPLPLTPQIPHINIVMIGETGSGKSSFLKTFATALSDSTDIKDIYRVSPKKQKESATKQIHFEPLYIDDRGPKLPCNFFDVPGIDTEGSFGKNELEKILKGEIKLDVSGQNDFIYERQRTTQAEEIHCILYVISSETNLKQMPPSLKVMTDIQEKRNTEDGVRQFVVVTFIDKIGVPNDDMKNAYTYQCVRSYCKSVSEVFGVDLFHVIPVSNYFEEVAPNDAKNAMSLFNLWRVFNSSKEYIERRWIRRETIMISKDWYGRKNST